jgi:hypothetical protein
VILHVKFALSRQIASPSGDHGGSPKRRRCSPISPNYQLHHVVFNTKSPGTAASSCPAVATTRQEDQDLSGLEEEGFTQPPDLSFSADTTIVGNVASHVHDFGYVASPGHTFASVTSPRHTFASIASPRHVFASICPGQDPASVSSPGQDPASVSSPGQDPVSVSTCVRDRASVASPKTTGVPHARLFLPIVAIPRDNIMSLHRA